MWEGAGSVLLRAQAAMDISTPEQLSSFLNLFLLVAFFHHWSAFNSLQGVQEQLVNRREIELAISHEFSVGLRGK